jgi:hypothetical protein
LTPLAPAARPAHGTDRQSAEVDDNRLDRSGAEKCGRTIALGRPALNYSRVDKISVPAGQIGGIARLV